MAPPSRLLDAFVVLAEERHVTRAAQRLGVSQPTATRQLRQLEDELGVALFRRHAHGLTLTAAGEALLPRAARLLQDWDEAVALARAAAAAHDRVLAVGFVSSTVHPLVRGTLARFSARHPDWRVELVQTAWHDSAGGLLENRTHAAVIRAPLPDDDRLTLRALHSEPRCLALPADHPLAARSTVDFPELLDEPFVALAPSAGPRRDFWLCMEQRGGHRTRIGAEVRTPDEWCQAVAAGLGVAVAPRSAPRFYRRPDIVYRPLRGVPPCEVLAAARRDGPAPVIDDFLDDAEAAARALAPADPGGVPGP